MDPKLVNLDAPGPESGITVADVRDVVRRLRENVAEFPGLSFLLDNVPDQYDPEKKLASVLLAGVVNLGPRVSRAEKERALANLQTIFNRAAEGYNARLLAGSISVDAWEAGLREELKAAHVSAYSAGRSGSWDTISFSEWGRLGQRIRRQYQFLNRFAGDIRAQGAEAFTPAYLDNRTSLYADNIREALEAGIARDRGLDPSALPAMPADGSTKCLTRCKCRWTIRTAGRDRYLVTWRLGNADHCETCNARAVDWRNLEVYKGAMISPVVPHFYNR